MPPAVSVVSGFRNKFSLSTETATTRRLALRVIAGIPTVELEWPVRVTDFDEALIVIPGPIARARRGRLRVCVAPELGYAIPSIEYVTDDGRVALSLTTSQYEACDSQVFFPRHAQCMTELDEGQQTSSFTVHRVEYVNQSLPAKEFAMQIPEGTRVRDSRPGVPTSVFYLNNQDQLEDLNRILEPTGKSRRSSNRIILLAINSLCLMVLLAVYVIHRCRHQPCLRS